ncbi:MAG: cofactor-independent phosphoglycerate mutase [Actinomycetia bacterium]|nr:cofactor-independent phosphoglycerate mutase [Actinomycetes bacterium]
MKYAVILMDGAAGYPLKQLQGKTCLQAARKVNIDYLAKRSLLGMVRTVPRGKAPGSDIANLSVMGYDPLVYHTGRSPLEAASMGIDLGQDQITFRCNLVTLGQAESYSKRQMIDHSAGEITTAESRKLIADLAAELESDGIRLYPGVSYRHIIVWDQGPVDIECTPPHDILGKEVTGYLPRGQSADLVLSMMEKSVEFLSSHPINMARQSEGKKPANSIWIWGQGTKPRLDSFYDKYGLQGAVISAVDLVKGIGICAGLEPVEVQGATGNLHTNFEGKAKAAVDQLKKTDFVYVHIEAPDECGHQGDFQGKIEAIERIDERVIGPIYSWLDSSRKDFKIMVLPDHPTPIALRTHTAEPVPFLIYNHQEKTGESGASYDEFWPAEYGMHIDEGHKLMDLLIGKKNE